MLEKSSFAALRFIMLFLVVNIVFLDLVMFTNTKRDSVSVVAPPERIETPIVQDTCGDACKADIRQEVDRKLAAVTQYPTPATTVTAIQLSTISSPAKEYYIPLGSGSTKNADWQDLASAEVYINTDNYPSIKSVQFEVYTHIPTANGRVYVKLYNVTDKHDVWFSEVSAEGNSVTRSEATMSLDKGNKLYRVMAKSTLQYDALIDNARVKIITY